MRTVRAAVAVVLVVAMLAPLVPWPLVVRAADANLARFPPSGWSVSLAGVGGSGYNDGDEATFGEFFSAGGENGAAVGYTFTRTGGAAFTVRSIRVLWGLRESPPYSPPNLERLRARCMEGSPIVWEDATGWSGEATYDTGRVDLTTPCTFDASTVGITVAFIGSLCCNRFVRVHEIELYAEVTDPQRRSDPGSAAAYAFGSGVVGHERVGDPVNVGTGSLTLQADDLGLPGRVLPLSFTRWYNSADTASGPLGAGWTHSYHWTLSDNATTVTVRRGDGRQDTFSRNADGSYAAPPGVFDTLVKNPDGSYALTLTSQVVYELSVAGRLVRIREPAGNQLALAYTGADLTSITDTVGRVVTLSYAGGRLTAVQDPLGRRVTYAYDAAARLVTVTDKIGNAPGGTPAAHQWKYAYDGATRHISTLTDPDGRVRVTSTYDADGRVSQQRDGLKLYRTQNLNEINSILMRDGSQRFIPFH